MQKIRKGDKVVVITGKDKGRQGEVLQVLPKEDRAASVALTLLSATSARRRRRKPALLPRKPLSIFPTLQSSTRTASRPASVSRL